MTEKKGDTLETLRTALLILKHLSSREDRTTAEIQQHLENHGIVRDVRTIQRLMKVLTEVCGVVCNDKSKPYGYRWPASAKEFSVRALTEPQALLLLLAQKHLQPLLPAEMLRPLSEFFTEAQAHVDRPMLQALGENKQHAAEWLDKVRVVSATQPLLPPTIDETVFSTISHALYANKWLDIDYTNQKQEAKSARVMPLGLAQQGERLYLVCRFQGYDNERTLVLNRIQKAWAGLETFERPKNFDIDQYDEDGRFGTDQGPSIRLQFNITKAAGLHLTESWLSHDQHIEDHGPYYAIAATVKDTSRLRQWLLGFGDAVWGVKADTAEEESTETLGQPAANA